ncbi:glycoside hydrolase family 2 TIM barrel-domain containing protein [Niabella sp.]|uniref:glycoside hydrolase family 2 protein n=1 Tax=Niabella sp. TaxID=1962976 RepID=UPI00261B094F|nr:glycoside hydrolase family 2 TIM barrel-domain containing protein [Niabella sp.]
MKQLNLKLFLIPFLFLPCYTLQATPVQHAAAKKAVDPAASPRITKIINREWTFNYFPEEKADKKGCEQPGFDDSKWPAVAVPHTWSTYETTGERHPFIRNPSDKDNPYWWKGWGWYRKRFSIDPPQKGKRIFIEFEGVQKYCKVYINGKYIGDHKGGYGSFDFDLTDEIQWGKENVLALAVNNDLVDRYSIAPMRAGNFDVYGGIYRDVSLVIKSPVYIPMQGSASHEGGTFITTPSLAKNNGKEGVVRVQTYVKNDLKESRTIRVKTIITDAQQKPVVSFEKTATLKPGELANVDQTSPVIQNPNLWSHESPYLYTVVSEVYDGNALADTYTSPLGFRWFWWDYKENFLYVNGKKMVIHGGNRHQEYAWLGDAIPKWITEMDYKDMAENLNYNFMRTAHYPNDKRVYQLTDQYGIAIDEELPNIKNQVFDKETQQQMLKEMIRRDRNHPSIMLWSMGNETNHAADSKWTLDEDTTRIITARRVLEGSQGLYAPHSDENLGIESLLRCNIRGWYNKDVKDMEPSDGQHAGTEEQQHQLLIKSNRLGTGNLCTWLYADHGADREYLNSPLKHINPKGYVDLYRQPKYSYYLWQANYLTRPMVWIMPHYWRSRYLGQKKDIVVDGSCETVELFVNGKSKGVQHPDKENFHSVVFKNIEIVKGEIKAIGKKGGQTVTSVIQMAAAPARLTLKASHTSVPAAKNSVIIITANIVDQNGVPVLGANNPLKWSVKGPATLVGPESYTSDIDSHEQMDGTLYTDAPVTNVIRSNGQPGEILVTLQSPNLSSATIKINAVTDTYAIAEIAEPKLSDAGRAAVAQNPESGNTVNSKIPVVIKETVDEFEMPGKTLEAYTSFITGYMAKKNPSADITSIEFKALAGLFASHMQNNYGRLVADDYNFNIEHFNKAAYLAKVISATLLPDLFKEGLRRYYAQAIIVKGDDKNVHTEEKRIKSIPAKGKLIVVGKPVAGNTTVQYMSTNDLEQLIRKIYPEAAGMSDEERLDLAVYLAQINPYIGRTTVSSQIRKQDKKTAEHFTIRENEPVWFPDYDTTLKKTKKKK